MKKIVSLLLVVFTLLSVTLLSACDSSNNTSINNNENSSNSSNKNQNVCSHSYIKTESKATCLVGGYATYKCSLCGDTYEEYENALGHTTSEGVCSRCGESFGSWEIAFYVDDFNNPTDEAYIRNSDVLYGTFSNSATTDSTLYAKVLIDADDIAIKLWEYGRNEVKAYTSTDYKITILDDSGTKHYTTGTMYKNGDRIRLADWTLVNLLQYNTKLKIYIQENSKYGVNSTYLFSVNNGNFNSIYNDFIWDYMD